MNNYKKRKLMLVLLFPLLLFLISGVVMLLWNALLPQILGVQAISYWQAMGIFVLSKILFGGFRGGKCGRQFSKHPMQNMNDDEREKFREMMKERFSKFCQK